MLFDMLTFWGILYISFGEFSVGHDCLTKNTL